MKQTTLTTLLTFTLPLTASAAAITRIRDPNDAVSCALGTNCHAGTLESNNDDAVLIPVSIGKRAAAAEAEADPRGGRGGGPGGMMGGAGGGRGGGRGGKRDVDVGDWVFEVQEANDDEETRDVEEEEGQVQRRDPKGGRKSGGSSSSGGSGSSTGKDFALDVASGTVSGGIVAGAEQLLNPQKRDPKGGRKSGGSSSSSSGGGGSSTGKDFALDVASGTISGGVVAGAEQLLNPQKRDPKGGRKSGGSTSSSGGGSSTGKDFALDVASGTVSGGIVAGAEQLLNPQKRDPKGGRKPSTSSSQSGSSTGKDIALDVASGTLSGGIVAGAEQLLNPQKRDPKGGRKSSSSTSSSGGGSSTGKDFALDVASGTVSGGIVAGAEQLLNPQKRDPKGGRKSGSSTSSSSGGSTAGGFAKDVAADILSGGVITGGEAILNQRNVEDNHPAQQKREPIGALLRLIPTIFRGASTAADVAGAASSEKRSEEPVERRGTESKGKELGKKIGAALADSDKKSGAAEAMARPGMLGLVTAGLAVYMVAGGLNAA
ncbi:hypothetical protein NEMBOFW57_009088 [Staphylotrichum longicolle]|uniref:Uncharacterized protein n=1 Tax=Staphylotrichum longicolle TaxID=669026 RepID=A0AAD4HWD9_9PEZI|nr:hypothetical protein NEMBOFW57_009088 [Staphylotrichum longicolle]